MQNQYLNHILQYTRNHQSNTLSKMYYYWYSASYKRYFVVITLLILAQTDDVLFFWASHYTLNETTLLFLPELFLLLYMSVVCCSLWNVYLWTYLFRIVFTFIAHMCAFFYKRYVENFTNIGDCGFRKIVVILHCFLNTHF